MKITAKQFLLYWLTVTNAGNLHLIETAQNYTLKEQSQMAQIGNIKQDFQKVSDLRGGTGAQALGLFQAQPTEGVFSFMTLHMQIWERKELLFD